MCETRRVPRDQPQLLERVVPPGLGYHDDFVTAEEEQALLDEIARIEFAPFAMRGTVARRRVAFFGRSYDAAAAGAPPMPDFLFALRARGAAWAGVEPAAFSMALINEYPPGAPIGWHRDAPQYGIVFGVSLLSACRMTFRPYVARGEEAAAGRPRRATHSIVLERRSAYLMTGPSREAYEHHIPAVSALRYSITFRTLRR